ncbi:hypothetical protein FHX88_004340 [Clostridium beijerinckii]|nr:hypothetical protein [Clostridium beijerinckii]
MARILAVIVNCNIYINYTLLCNPSSIFRYNVKPTDSGSVYKYR